MLLPSSAGAEAPDLGLLARDALPDALLDVAEEALAAGVAVCGGASQSGLLWREGIISASLEKKLLHMIKH